VPTGRSEYSYEAYNRDDSAWRSNDANLVSLSVGAVSIPLVEGTYAYAVEVPSGTTSIAINAQTSEPHAIMSIRIDPFSGTKMVELSPGENPYAIRVLAQDGQSIKRYLLTITVPAS
jgi:hypothetical protein